MKLASISTSRVIKWINALITNDKAAIAKHIFINPYEPVAKIMGKPINKIALPSCVIQAVLFTITFLPVSYTHLTLPTKRIV